MSTIAIVGASGFTGSKLCEILTDKLDGEKIVMYGNASVGQKLCYFGKTYTVKHIDSLKDDDVDYALFMTNEEVSAKYIPQLVEKKVVCIDNSSAFRLKKDVPLVVPQINAQDIGRCKLVANPNCTTIQVAIALAPLQKLGMEHLTVVTYQAASGAGKEGLTDLTEKRTYGKLKSFPHPLFDNVIAQIGNVLPSGNTTEENKLRFETGKILHQSSLAVNAFCVRVPVTVGHCAFVNVRLQQSFEIEQIRSLLKNTKDVLLFDDAQQQLFPMPAVLRHTHFVGVGRIFRDDTGKGVNMFVVADNLLRGAAYNAYQILIQCMKNNGDLQ